MHRKLNNFRFIFSFHFFFLSKTKWTGENIQNRVCLSNKMASTALMKLVHITVQTIELKRERIWGKEWKIEMEGVRIERNSDREWIQLCIFYLLCSTLTNGSETNAHLERLNKNCVCVHCFNVNFLSTLCSIFSHWSMNDFCSESLRILLFSLKKRRRRSGRRRSRIC